MAAEDLKAWNPNPDINKRPALTHRPDIDHPKRYDWWLGKIGVAFVSFKG